MTETPSLLEEPLDDVDALVGETAVAAVRDYCGWHIAPTIAETFTLDGGGRNELSLPTLHLVSVSAVRVLGETLDPEFYEWSLAGFVRLRSVRAHFPDRLRAVEIDVEHGFPSVPLSVRQVIAGLVRRGEQAAGVTAQTVGPFSVTYGDAAASGPIGIDAYSGAVLDRLRLPSWS